MCWRDSNAARRYFKAHPDEADSSTAAATTTAGNFNKQPFKGTLGKVAIFSSCLDSAAVQAQGLSDNWHAVCVLLREGEIFIFDPDLTLPEEDPKPRLADLKGVSVVKAALQGAAVKSKAVWIGGGGNPGLECQRMAVTAAIDIVKAAVLGDSDIVTVCASMEGRVWVRVRV